MGAKAVHEHCSEAAAFVEHSAIAQHPKQRVFCQHPTTTVYITASTVPNR